MSASLRTNYLGFELASPFIASSSPLTGDLESLLDLEHAGASAVVLPSLFEEEISDQTVQGLTLPATYAMLLGQAKESLRIPVIASLNGTTPGGWLRLAELIQLAGADAIELNVYAVETDPYTSGAAVEDRTLRIVNQVKTSVTVPVAVKVSPYYSSFAHMADRLADARADGLVLFNRFLQPDIDVETLSITSGLTLSSSDEVRLALRWIALLSGRLSPSLAATGGVHTANDAIKLLLAGADAVMVTSAALERGPSVFRTLTDGLQAWLDGHGYVSVEQIKGTLSQIAVTNPADFERAQYIHALEEDHY